MQPAAVAVAAVTVVVALGVRRLRPGWPSMLAGLVAATALAWAWTTWLAAPAQPLRSVGQIDTPWPVFSIPRIQWAALPELLGLAFALDDCGPGPVDLDRQGGGRAALASASTQTASSGARGCRTSWAGFFSSYVSCGSLNRSMPKP